MKQATQNRNYRLTAANTLMLLLLLVVIGSHGCKRPNRLDVDVSNIIVKPTFHHFDDALFTIPDTLFLQQFPDVYRRYSQLFIDAEPDSLLVREMRLFASEPRFIELYERRREVLGNMEKEKEAITRILQHYLYHFPDASVPEIYTHIVGLDLSLLQAAILVTDTVAIISTDFFLGEDFEPYRFIGIPQYQIRWMRPTQIPPRFARELAFLHAGNQDEVETILDEMIYQGKILYFMDAMMPRAHDTTKIRYTHKQLQWIEENQRHVWAYLINNQMLYSSDLRHSQMMIQESPFTAAFTEQSPGRMGHWFGWQIVRRFMDRHPEVSVQELMEMDDAQQILSASGYKPR